MTPANPVPATDQATTPLAYYSSVANSLSGDHGSDWCLSAGLVLGSGLLFLCKLAAIGTTAIALYDAYQRRQLRLASRAELVREAEGMRNSAEPLPFCGSSGSSTAA